MEELDAGPTGCTEVQTELYSLRLEDFTTADEMQSSGAISHTNITLISNASQTISASIIRD
jgi:hypothetical protein